MPDATQLLGHFHLKLGGEDAPDELLAVTLEVRVESSLHLPDVATLVVHDPGARWVDDARLWPGKTLVVEAEIGRAREKVFDGEIVELEPDYLPGTMRLTVRAFDRLHRLSRGRRARSFLNVTDGDIVKKIADEVGLQAEVGSTREVFDYVFQNNETNLEFLGRRAAALGYLLFVRDKTLHFEPPAHGEAVELNWNEGLGEFRPRLSSVDQPSEFVARGWDPEAKQAVVGRATRGNHRPALAEDPDGGSLAKGAFEMEAPWLVADRPLRKQSVAESLAQATADRHGGRFVVAEGSCGGNPKVRAGTTVKIGNVGRKFGGEYLVTSAAHAFAGAEGYGTEFTVSGGQPSTLLGLLQPEPDRSSLGLAVGVVTNNDDPRGQGRVKVKYPWLSDDQEGDWARLVGVGGGPDRGVQFIPEVNDEVLVGFELGDIHHPYVLGGLWNGQDSPPRRSGQIVSGGKVKERVIVSRLGHEVVLNDSDDAPGVVVRTKAGHVISLEDRSGGARISVKDKTGRNTLVIDSEQNSLEASVMGDVKIKAGGSMTLEATASLDIKGATVTVEGQATAALKAPSVDVNGSGMVNVTGGLIKLN